MIIIDFSSQLNSFYFFLFNLNRNRSLYICEALSPFISGNEVFHIIEILQNNTYIPYITRKLKNQQRELFCVLYVIDKAEIGISSNRTERKATQRVKYGYCGHFVWLIRFYRMGIISTFVVYLETFIYQIPSDMEIKQLCQG